MPSENNMPSDPATPMALHQGTSPVPGPSQPTRRLIRLSSPERQRLSSLHLTPDPEMEPPPKPPRSCSALARQALEASFKGWGMPVQSPQGSCWLRVGMGWVVFGFLERDMGHGEGGHGDSSPCPRPTQFLRPWKRGKKRVPPPVKRKQRKRKMCLWTQTWNR